MTILSTIEAAFSPGKMHFSRLVGGDQLICSMSNLALEA